MVPTNDGRADWGLCCAFPAGTYPSPAIVLLESRVAIITKQYIINKQVIIPFIVIMTNVPDWLIRRLRTLPGIRVEMDPIRGRITLRSPGARPIVYRIIPASGISGAEATRRAKVLSRKVGAEHTLLAVRSLPNAIRDDLADAGVSWAEQLTGHLHLQAAPLFIHVEGRGQPSELPTQTDPSTRPTRLVGLAGRCAETLLLLATTHGRLKQTVTATQLARLSGVTQPQATYVLHRLERENVIKPTRTGGRTWNWNVVDAAGLLDLWNAEDIAPVEETQIYAWSRAPQETLQGLVRLNKTVKAWALGGAAAANLYAPTLTTYPVVTVWIPNAAPVEDVATALGGQVVSEGGSITIRQTVKDPWSLHRLSLPANENENAPVDDDEAARLRRILHEEQALPPFAERWSGLSLVSRPRAIIETLRDGRGRYEEIAVALRNSLTLTTGTE